MFSKLKSKLELQDLFARGIDLSAAPKIQNISIQHK